MDRKEREAFLGEEIPEGACGRRKSHKRGGRRSHKGGKK